MAVRFNPKRLFRFSIGTLLFAMLCVSIYLGSHRAGQTAGAKDRYDESHFVKVYNLADLMVAAPEVGERDELCDSIVELLQSTVAPQSWVSGGADGEQNEIQRFPTHPSLVITQQGAVHDQIDAALRKYRDQRMKAQNDQAAAAIERLAVDEQTKPVVQFEPGALSKVSADAGLAWAAVDLRYENTVRNLTERWGNPYFSGKCTDAGFPDWSVAQSIATWPKNGGDAYLAVQDWPEVGRVMLIGWRRRD